MDNIAELTAFIPVDRRFALLKSEDLPYHCSGCALFADISGFTSLTETLADELGPKRGADEMTRHIDIVYSGLMGEIERYHGSVISFAGDAVTCWFDGDDGRKAIASALAMQEVMRGFEAVRTPAGTVVHLAIKIALASGEARRFVVGDPNIQFIDALAGATLDRMAAAEKHANKGEVVATSEIVEALAGEIEVSGVEDEGRRTKDEGQEGSQVQSSKSKVHPSQAQDPSSIVAEGHYVVHKLLREVLPDPWPQLSQDALTEEQVRPWVLPAVYEQLRAGQGSFLSEIRPVVPLFLHFGGIDYDGDPDAGKKLDAFVRWAQNIVTQYGGAMLEVVIGDKGSVLYSVFGAPVAHDDAPLRAVAASIELRSVPPELQYISSVQLGVSWGRTRSGPYGAPTRRNYGVLGDQVNLAARLMGKAQPGEVLVSPRVAQAVNKQYALRELGEISLKGKREPVLVSSVIGPSAPAHHADSYLPDALVGRESELAQIDEALSGSLAGKGIVLQIEGPAGVGKSHLSGELIRQARERGMKVAIGACRSTSTGVAYAPWRQVVRAILELDQATDRSKAGNTQSSIADIEQRLLTRNPDWALRLPLLGDLLGVPFPENATTAAFDPRLRQAALFDLIGEMVESWADEQPLLLLMDDVHWMDAASQDLTLAIARRIGQLPSMVVLVNRPPVPDQEIISGVDRLAWHRHLVLGDLSTEGVAALLANRLQGPISPLAASLIQLETQGNPFFVEEVVESLRESGGLLLGDGGEWVLSEKLLDALRAADGLKWQEGEWVIAPTASLAVLHQGLPDTVEGVVLSRIDRLSEAHKLSLRVASVIGHIFPLDLLALAHPMQPTVDQLHEQIESPEVRDFARPETGDRDQGSGIRDQGLATDPYSLVYAFKHNITHDVAYGTLLNEQRKQLHKAVSDGLERLTPDDVSQLAYHTFAGEDWSRALRYQEQAGQHAQKLFANYQAIEHFRKALASVDKLATEEEGGRRKEEGGKTSFVAPSSFLLPPSSFLPGDTNALRQRIYIGLGELFTVTGQYTTAFENLEKGLQISEQLTDSDAQARACRWMARAYENLGDYSAALEWIGKGLERLGGQETSAAAELLSIAGLIHSRLGDHNQALENCQSSLTMAEKLGDKSTLAFGYNLLGHITRLRGDKTQAIEHFETALQLYGQVNNAGGEAISHNQVANVYFDLSKWVDADRHYRLARDIFNRIGDVYNLVFLNNNLGGIALNQGRLDEALQFYDEALQSLEQIGGSPYVIGALHMNLGATFVRRGEIGAAREHLRQSRELFDQAKVRDFLPEMYRHLAAAALSAGDLDKAIEEAEQAINLARELNMRGEEGSALRVLGEIAQQTDQDAQAEEYLSSSLVILREVGDEYESARTELALAELLITRDQGSGVEGEHFQTEYQSPTSDPQSQGIAALERCIATFERLGALADLSKAFALRDRVRE